MKIAALEIDGYGVWSGLKVKRLSESMNVLYGPNEAGKTTLLQFVRSMLYGFSAERQRYFPPVHGGPGGGWIELVGAGGRIRVERRDPRGADASGEQLVLSAADGTRQGEHVLNTLLAGVDEPAFNNIFAVELREMQELGALDDGEAAQLLYNLSLGVDRVSLVDAMCELEASRNRILDRSGGPCQAATLLAEREKIRGEIDGLDELMRRYGRLAAERVQLDREIARLVEEKDQAEHHSRVIDLAISLRQRWERRAAAAAELAALGPQQPMPDNAVARLDAVNGKIQRRRQRLEQFELRRKELRAEAAGLEVHESLTRLAPRIEAMQEQGPWINSLQGQVVSLEKEAADIAGGIAGQQEQLGLDGDAAALPAIPPRTLSTLRSAGGGLRQARKRLAGLQQAAETAEGAAGALAAQIDAAIGGRQDRELSAAIDRAGNVVAQFRRRIQIDERLEQMAGCQRDLEAQTRRLLGRQLLPGWALVGLGAVFVLGVVLVLTGLFLPASLVGPVGWAMAVLGLGGCAAAGLGKVLLERSNARQLEACQNQLNLLQLQLKQMGEDRDAMDGQLPRGGPIAGRLAAAEKDLAALEELMPVDARLTAAKQESAAARERLVREEQELAVVRRRWRSALAAAGLPRRLAPGRLKLLSRKQEQIAQLQRQLAQRQEELAQRRRELDSLFGRITQLVGDAGIELGEGEPTELLRRLADALTRQQALLTQRRAANEELRRNRRDRAKLEEAIGRLKARRRQLLREAGARDQVEFRRRAVEAARAASLQRDRDAFDQEIAAAVAGHCAQETIRQILEDSPAQELEPRRDDLLQRWAAAEEQLQQRFEKRGQLAEQVKSLADDRQLAQKQLDLGMVEKRLDDALRRWQTLAVAGRVLDGICSAYERQRQPETLQEASGYLERLTGGRYLRVWTPLGQNVLRVDDADGRWLPVEALSRGTREQLFLSLRLALVAGYARRGAPLPLILDDVLVNFDIERARAAVAVLRDFAAAGHQVLIFTCHEHMLRLFKSLHAPVGCLPDNRDLAPAAIILDEPGSEKSARSRRSPSGPRRAAARLAPVEPEEDADFDEDEPCDECEDSDGEPYDEGGGAEAA